MTKQEQKLDRLVKLVREHAAAEAAGDIDATMATVSRRPVYEFYPLGYRMTDWNTIKEYYRMSLIENQMLKGRVTVGPLSASFGDKNSTPTEDIWWYGNDSLITRDDLWATDDKNVERSMRFYAVFKLDGDLLLGETYFTTQFGADILRPIVSKCFDMLPGVSIIV